MAEDCDNPCVRDTAERLKFKKCDDGSYAVQTVPGCPEKSPYKNTPKVTNYTISDLLEHSHTFQDDLKAYTIRVRTAARMYIAFNAGKTDPSTSSEVWTNGLGGVYREDRLNALQNFVIYFRLDRINRVVEIKEWT